MGAMLTETITGPSAWRGCDPADDPSWRHTLSPEDIAALDAALATATARGATCNSRITTPLCTSAPISRMTTTRPNGARCCACGWRCRTPARWPPNFRGETGSVPP